MENYKTEIRKILIESPLPELKIGDDFLYKGIYVHGYEEGVSKIKRFYKEVFYLNDKESGRGDDSIIMELENSKLILLGFLSKKGVMKFREVFD